MKREDLGLGRFWRTMWGTFRGSRPFAVLGWQVLAALPSLVGSVLLAVVLVAGVLGIIAGSSSDSDDVGGALATIAVVGLLAFVLAVVASLVSYVLQANFLARISEQRLSFREMTWFRRGWRVVGVTLVLMAVAVVLGIVLVLVVVLLTMLFTGGGDPLEEELAGPAVFLTSFVSAVLVMWPMLLFSLAGPMTVLGEGVFAAVGHSAKVTLRHWKSFGVVLAVSVAVVLVVELVAEAFPVLGLLYLLVLPLVLVGAVVTGVAQATVLGLYRGTVAPAPR